MLMANDPEQVMLTGNRFGKSTALAVKLLLMMLGKHPLQRIGAFSMPPLECRAVGSDFENGIDKIIIPILMEWCPATEIAHSPVRSKDRRLVLNNGSYLEFFSQEQEVIKFEGTGRDIVWNDELGKEEIYNVNRKRVMSKQGQIWTSLTPDKRKGFTFEYRDLLLKDGIEGIKVYRGSTYDNKENLPPEAFKLWLSKLTPDDIEVYVYGNFKSLAGLLFNLNPSTNIVPVTSYKRISSWTRARGLDIGGAGPEVSKPTAALFVTINPVKKIVYVEDEYIGEGKTISENAESIKRKSRGYYFYQTYIDPVSGSIHSKESGKTIMHLYRHYGIPCVPGTKDVQIGVDSIKDALKYDEKIGSSHLIICSNCQRLIKEMQTITNDKLADGHLIAALRWLLSTDVWKNIIERRIDGAFYEGEDQKYNDFLEISGG